MTSFPAGTGRNVVEVDVVPLVVWLPEDPDVSAPLVVVDEFETPVVWFAAPVVDGLETPVVDKLDTPVVEGLDTPVVEGFKAPVVEGFSAAVVEEFAAALAVNGTSVPVVALPVV